MKRVMLLVAALLLCAGVASAQTCVSFNDIGGNEVWLTITVDGQEEAMMHLNVWDVDMWNGGDWDGIVPLTDDINDATGWHIEWGDGWEYYGFDDDGVDPVHANFADAFDAGGFGEAGCVYGATMPAGPFVWIEGGLSTRESGDPVVLEANLSDNWASTDTPTYQWTGPGGDLGTADTEDLGNVAPGDAGLYTVAANDGTDDFTDGFVLHVIGAVPLAGGLGLGLLAGACALAATVVIRRKK